MITNAGRERNGEIESAANQAISIFEMMLTGRTKPTRHPHETNPHLRFHFRYYLNIKRKCFKKNSICFKIK